jgi:hypothetical protein
VSRLGNDMACRISELVLNCRDPSRLAAFWCEVLGYAEFARDADSLRPACSGCTSTSARWAATKTRSLRACWQPEPGPRTSVSAGTRDGTCSPILRAMNSVCYAES